jgi:23S rRNA A1618 N6-methylase RlmF
MKRDKSNDIIVGNSFMKNEEFQKEMFNKIFYEKLRDFFSNYLDRMNPSEKELMETQKSKKIRVRKMF